MPTGYTADLYEGKDVKLEEYILKCARAFGATIDMRDEPLNKEIPEFQPSTYHKEQIIAAETRLNQYENMNIIQAQKVIDEEYGKALNSYHQRVAEKSYLRLKYEHMLKRVESWIPPSEDHQELKNFATEQLRTSIDHDCSTSYLRKPTKQNAVEWLDGVIQMNRNDINYHRKHWFEELDRTEERNTWVRLLRESLESN